MPRSQTNLSEQAKSNQKTVKRVEFLETENSNKLNDNKSNESKLHS